MSKVYHWAVLGCGRMAAKFSKDLKLLPNARLYAAASRDMERSKVFAKELGFEKAYGSYEEMVNDPKVDIVYIATPHSYHCVHAQLCMNHKKAALCEKAFAINSREVSEMIACSRSNNTFLMEAFWTRFQPSFMKAMEIVRSGRLGKLKMVRSDFAFNAEKDPVKRLYNVELGGGSLLDIGIYPVFAAIMALGKPLEIKTLPQFSFTGSEESIMMSFRYPEGAMAVLVSSFASHSSTQTEYCCERGYLRLNKRWFAPTQISIWESGWGEEQTILLDKPPGNGYQFEAAHVMKCLEEGKIDSDMMPLQTSLDLMEVLDMVRHDAGIVFSKHD